MSNKGKEIFRPYARLITVLGDQLITNKIVAVNEIVKNSYDADSESVTVRFCNLEYFNVPAEQRNGKDPYIEIEDDGDGMSIDIIRKVWLRPATPNKISLKQKKGKQQFTKRGRIMQGEKGIGRFAVHKLGDEIRIYSRQEGKEEAELHVDFKQYEQEGQLDIFDDDKSEYKFLDQVTNDWFVNSQPKVIKKPKGTLIKITHLRESWTERELLRLEKSFQNLITPLIPEEDNESLGSVNLVRDFNVQIEVDNEEFSNQDTKVTFEKIARIAPYKFIARVDEQGGLTFEYSGELAKSRKTRKSFNLLDNDLDLSLKSIKDRFFETDEDGEFIMTHKPKCGPFSLVLYGYDFYDKAKWKTKKDESDFIRKHNVFLYRDGVRVYPYGEAGIDWLDLGKRRSEEKAGWYFSNNDLVGFLFISHEKNSLLKDATNREGIMDQEGAFEDFRALMIAIVQVMKSEADIDKAREQEKAQIPIKKIESSLQNTFKEFTKKLEVVQDQKTIEVANKYLDNSKSYVSEMSRRAEIYEDLAGLGMAVEKASHDTLTLLNKMSLNLGDIKKRLINNKIEKEELIELISDLEDNTYFLYEQLQIIEPLFRYEKRTERNVSVQETIEKVFRYYRYEISNYGIDTKILCERDIKLKIGTGLILQIFINLLDNAVYWLHNKTEKANRRITVKVDHRANEIVFADSGPGIDENAVSYVFLEFFTRKEGKAGRGLGLYIVKEILDRIGASIEVITNPTDKIEKGANFKISFPNNE